MPHINIDYDHYQYSLGSMVNLVPLPKMILYWLDPPVTHCEAACHKLSCDELNQTSFRKRAFFSFGLHLKVNFDVYCRDSDQRVLVLHVWQTCWWSDELYQLIWLFWSNGSLIHESRLTQLFIFFIFQS